MRLNIDCDLSSKTINWSADSFQINHVASMSWHMSPRYGHGILVSGYPILTAVNVQCKRCGLGKTRLRHPFLPFESLPYPTRTIRRRARTYARSITWQPNEKRLTIFYEYGALKRAREPRYSSPQERWISVNLSIVFRTWAHFLAWLSKFISTVYFCWF